MFPGNYVLCLFTASLKVTFWMNQFYVKEQQYTPSDLVSVIPDINTPSDLVSVIPDINTPSDLVSVIPDINTPSDLVSGIPDINFELLLLIQ
ncbi:hypothetical protein AVEN_26785-1 [Araneus ventricosus]|uniref:Uncharacterized protein n=1 Tax=Araneus ventricosus TaxID=182803 RepID=A0A4Y2D554_ARAVE|nr:hypothetical protein AVEN_26785-1 [Araneus ventricosus]